MTRKHQFRLSYDIWLAIRSRYWMLVDVSVQGHIGMGIGSKYGFYLSKELESSICEYSYDT